MPVHVRKAVIKRLSTTKNKEDEVKQTLKICYKTCFQGKNSLKCL